VANKNSGQTDRQTDRQTSRQTTNQPASQPARRSFLHCQGEPWCDVPCVQAVSYERRDAKHQTDIQSDRQTDIRQQHTRTRNQPCHAIEPYLTYHPQKKKMQTGRSVGIGQALEQHTHTHTHRRKARTGMQVKKNGHLGDPLPDSLPFFWVDGWMDGWMDVIHSLLRCMEEGGNVPWVGERREGDTCVWSVWSSITYLGGGKRWIDVMHVSWHAWMDGWMDGDIIYTYV